MSFHALFPTLVYVAPLQTGAWQAFNRRLLSECIQLRLDDEAGQRWSATNYSGGYTSYHSAHRMHQLSPTFATLEQRIDVHVRKYARKLELDLEGRELTMTDCWVNIMPRQVVHGLHLHPLSTISGTYYVQTPKSSPGLESPRFESSGLKFEDPRLDRFMAAPPKRSDARPEHRPWFVVPARAGNVVLFESWLRHEVPPNPTEAERISVSFNYSWF